MKNLLKLALMTSIALGLTAFTFTAFAQDSAEGCGCAKKHEVCLDKADSEKAWRACFAAGKKCAKGCEKACENNCKGVVKAAARGCNADYLKKKIKDAAERDRIRGECKKGFANTFVDCAKACAKK